MVLHEGKCIMFTNIFVVYSLWSASIKYHMLSHASTGDISLQDSSGSHCLMSIVDIKPRQSILAKL